MRPFSIRRVGAATVVLALASLPVLGGTPAQAAPKPKIDFIVPDYTEAPGGESDILRAFLYAERTVTHKVGTVHLTYRLSGTVPGVYFGESGTPSTCRLAQPDDVTVMECWVSGEQITPRGVDAGSIGYLGAGPAAVPGAIDTMTTTLTVPGYAPIVRTSKIRIGEAVHLATPNTIPTVSRAIGATADVRLPLANRGEVAARGVYALIGGDRAFEPRTRFRNCWYADDQLTACHFAQTVEPGADYQVTLPFRVRRDTYGPSSVYGGTQWITPAEFDDQAAFARARGLPAIGTPGTGPVLALERLVTARAELPQASATYTGTGWQVDVTGTQGADLTGAGDVASGRKGSTVTVSVGVHDNGPATVIPRDPITVGMVFYVPRGTTAVQIPYECAPVSTDGTVDSEHFAQPGFPRYYCPINEPIVAGRSVTRDFGLRIDTVITGVKGAVTVTRFTQDLDKTNNRADVVINPAVAGPDNPGEGSSGGAGGGLPITGPAGAELLAAGSLLVGGGAVLLLVTTRRRTQKG